MKHYTDSELDQELFVRDVVNPILKKDRRLLHAVIVSTYENNVRISRKFIVFNLFGHTYFEKELYEKSTIEDIKICLAHCIIKLNRMK